MDGIDKTSDVYKNAYDAVVSQADEFVETYKSNPYGVAISEFNWGSNMTIANFGNISALAYQLTGKQTYLDAANAQLDYLLGENANGVCFVSGWGTVSPQHPHHRPSMVAKKAMKGMLVGGVDQSLDDSAAKAYCVDAPPAKCWIDNSESYSTNEITIYWNSPLTYLVSELLSDGATSADSDVLWGDANCDGNVNMADAVFIMQSIASPDKYVLSDKGFKNADVNENGNGITNKDALAIQKYKLGLIDSLPESYSDAPIVTTTTVPSTTTTTTTAPKSSTSETPEDTTTTSTTARRPKKKPTRKPTRRPTRKR
jgi:endoglucanase